MDPSVAKSAGITMDAGFRVIMFTDLNDSTLMTTLYGDTKALHLLHIHNSLTRTRRFVRQGRSTGGAPLCPC